MIIHGKRNTVSVCVDGYEFPDLSQFKPQVDEYDLNWLNVSVFCTGTQADFLRRKDPCILVFELEETVRELTRVLHGQTFLYVSREYLEPGLRFCAMGNGSSFVIGIRYVYDMSGEDWKTVSAAQRFSLDEFSNILGEMKQWLEEYPFREPADRRKPPGGAYAGTVAH